jgi:putative hydrolase of the HAD superfamily
MGYQRSEITHLLIDLDDTVYPPDKPVWSLIEGRIQSYLTDVVGVPAHEAFPLRERLYTTYGTTLRGLQIEYSIDINHYNDYVHNVSYAGLLEPDYELQEVLKSISQEKWIFTNASVKHAESILSSLELQDQFVGIIDVVATSPWCKPYPEAFHIALALCGSPDPTRCLFIDDRIPNLDTAADLGFKTALVSTEESSARHPAISRLALIDDLLEAI